MGIARLEGAGARFSSMNLSDLQQELKDLEYRLQSMDTYIRDPAFASIGVEEKGQLLRQQGAMDTYHQALYDRIRRLGGDVEPATPNASMVPVGYNSDPEMAPARANPQTDARELPDGSIPDSRYVVATKSDEHAEAEKAVAATKDQSETPDALGQDLDTAVHRSNRRPAQQEQESRHRHVQQKAKVQAPVRKALFKKAPVPQKVVSKKKAVRK